jgi:hypothetical protein
MNGDNRGPQRHGRNRGPQRAGLAAVTAAAAALAAACGGGATPPAGPAAGGPARYQQALAYSRCMRAHGVPDFPDPDASGNIIQHVSGGQPPDNGPRAQAADSTCHHLLPGGGAGGPGVQRRIVNELLQLARCMRAHGEPDFPDPTVGGTPGKGNNLSLPGNITLGLAGAGIVMSSARFRAAEHACRSLAPPGLFAPGHPAQ